MNSTLPCPCCSGHLYAQCCKSLHDGSLPKDALQLMRSRYSAYVLNLPDYIVATTHPASPQYSENKFSWKRSISQFSKTSSFQKLEILNFKESGTLATVTFIAHLSQDGSDASFTEHSYFEKIKDKWFYRIGRLVQGHAPNLVTVGQLRMLPLAYYGDPILRQKASTIDTITEEIKKLVEEMIETMDACDGIGLAAPQIHHAIRLFIIRVPDQRASNELALGKIKVLINPKISLPSEETWKADEGCLSIPTIHASVERPKAITVEYTDMEGNPMKERVFGWEARVILHENDHIDGILFVDRLDEQLRLNLKKDLQNLEKRLKSHRNL